ncbi:MlaD family protein [Plastoroseomonas hellenica]|uniref:MlaD family protein n=1 Tax=Plastoroseomonas hellenica TaxID=2687306 RepID=UPI001BAA4C8E|nr:MlaD family protein [Plastoroseomonas hellenica]MBR0641671.1 MCE family protein [Plastoroseomonas hellenica]
MAARPAAIGGFVLGGLALVVIAIMSFGGARVFEAKTRAVVFFEGSVAGLDIGAPVTFRGVRVGSVQRVALHLAADGHARIPVTIELQEGQVVLDGVQREQLSLERLVAAGLRAQLNSQSFVTGQLRIDLDFRPGTPAEQVADTGGLPQIPAIPSDLDRLRDTLADVPVRDAVQTGQRALAAIEQLANRLDRDLGPVLDSVRRVADSADRTLDTSGQAIARLQADASRSLQEIDGLMADARQQLGARGEELARVLGAADRAARQADTMITSLNSLTTPRSAFRGDLEAAIRDLAATASSLRGFARAVERDPSAILRGRDAR